MCFYYLDLWLWVHIFVFICAYVIISFNNFMRAYSDHCDNPQLPVREEILLCEHGTCAGSNEKMRSSLYPADGSLQLGWGSADPTMVSDWLLLERNS